jgi:hypothetical protein
MPARIGYLLIVIGVGLAIVGLLIVLRVRVPWLGRLPGDIHIERDGTHIYIPIATCLVVSLILTAIATLIAMLLRRR